jgi:sialidase-1
MIDGGVQMPNECQAVDLGNNTVLVNSRSLFSHRLQSISTDGGETFSTAVPVPDLYEPLEGCEGSIIKHPMNDWLFFSNPTSHVTFLRLNMSLHISTDNGSSWQLSSVIDDGPSGYSALAVLTNNSVALLYERSPPPPQLVMIPQHISFTVVWSPTDESSSDSEHE